MKKLILIRHSKSSWDYPLNDFDRPLTENGITKAINVAKNTSEFIPTQKTIWSSSANRAKSTAILFVQNWNLDIQSIHFFDELYTFDDRKLAQIVKSCPNSIDNLILFGHNSAITDFVNKFGDIFIDNVPTAGFVSITFETNNWKDISKGKINKILFPSHC